MKKMIFGLIATVFMGVLSVNAQTLSNPLSILGKSIIYL